MARALGSPGLVFAGVGVHGRGGALRGAQLRRAGGALPGGGRRLRLPARGLRAGAGLPLRLEVPAGDGPRAHRGARDGSRRLRAGHVPGARRRRRWRSSAIVAIAAANVLGVRLAGADRPRPGGRQDRCCSSALVAWGFASGAGDVGALRAVLRRGAPAPGRCVPALAGALVLAFFSFGGWWEAAKLAGEVRDPQRTLPRALALGVGAVTLLYVARERGLPVPRPDRGARLGRDLRRAGGRSRSSARAAAARSRRSWSSSCSAALRVHDLRPAALLRDGARRRRSRASAAGIHPRIGTPVRRSRSRRRSRVAARGARHASTTIVAYFVFVTVAFLALTVAGLYRLPRPEPGAYRVPGWPVTPARLPRDAARDSSLLLGAGSPRQAAARRRWSWPPAFRSTVCSSRRGAPRRARTAGGSLMAWIKTIPFDEADEALQQGARGPARALPEGVRSRTARRRRQREHRRHPHAHPRGAAPRLRDLRGAHVARRCRSRRASTR